MEGKAAGLRPTAPLQGLALTGRASARSARATQGVNQRKGADVAAASGAKRIVRETETIIEKGEEGDDQDEGEERAATELHPEAPLFSTLLRTAKKVESVGVRRTDPDSGYLGTMPPDMTESSLKARFGGGSYRLEAKNVNNQIVKDGVRIVKIAGDPVFTSEVEESEWRRAHGLKPKPAESSSAGGSAGQEIKDLFLLWEERDEKRRREDRERETRERAEAAAREERERKEQTEREERERRRLEEIAARERKEQEDREERRRQAQREDDDRRARQHREDMDRMQAQNAATLQQSQQFFQQLAAASKTEGKNAHDPIATLVAGVQLAQTIGGGGSDRGVLGDLFSRLPETLAEVRKTAGAAYNEVKRSKGGAGASGAPELRLQGPLALKAKRVLLRLKAAGQDPEKAIDQLLTVAEAQLPARPRPRPKGKPAAPARRPAAAAARRRPPNRAPGKGRRAS